MRFKLAIALLLLFVFVPLAAHAQDPIPTPSATEEPAPVEVPNDNIILVPGDLGPQPVYINTGDHLYDAGNAVESLLVFLIAAGWFIRNTNEYPVAFALKNIGITKTMGSTDEKNVLYYAVMIASSLALGVITGISLNVDLFKALPPSLFAESHIHPLVANVLSGAAIAFSAFFVHHLTNALYKFRKGFPQVLELLRLFGNRTPAG